MILLLVLSCLNDCSLFVIGLESLPKDLRKNFNQMRDLDSKSQGAYNFTFNNNEITRTKEQ